MGDNQRVRKRRTQPRKATEEELESAHSGGFQAAKLGYNKSQNPYAYNTDRYFSWRRGWVAGFDEKEAEMAAFLKQAPKEIDFFDGDGAEWM